MSARISDNLPSHSLLLALLSKLPCLCFSCAPMTVHLGLHRKQLMEAWEVAEWEGREAQIRTLQEAQLKEFEDTIKAKHAQVPSPFSLIFCRIGTSLSPRVLGVTRAWQKHLSFDLGML